MKKILFSFAIFGITNCMCMNSQITVEQHPQAASRFTIQIPDYVQTYTLKNEAMRNAKDDNDVLQFYEDDDTELSNQQMDSICISNQK